MRKASLRNLLQKKEKPVLQKNDLISLSWIKQNKPDFKSIKKQTKILKNLLLIKPWSRFNDGFYVKNEILNGIHGRNHAKRVAINIVCLFFEKKLQGKVNINDLIYSALFHDCSRINDNKDENHGERSSFIFQQIINQFNIEDRVGVLISMKFHNYDRDTLLKNVKYKKNKLICDLLKTADSLDRYRFPRSDWWINDQYLDIIPSDNLKNFSFNLCSNSEMAQIKNRGVNYDSEIKKILYKK